MQSKTEACLLMLLLLIVCSSTEGRSPTSRNSRSSFRFPGRRYDDSDEDIESMIGGGGRDYDLLDTRPPTRNASSNPQRRRAFKARVPQHHGPSLFQSASEWWSTNLPYFPKLIFRVEPTTTLKITKTFKPLGTIVKLGAEFNTLLGVWQFKSSWEDAIIGGKLTLAGKELQLTKSWQLSMGPVEDLVTRLRFRAAVDLQTWKAYARVGFRTERLSPINVMEGFTLRQTVPLSGPKGPIKMEIKANVALPEPEIEYSTENQRSLIGMGDIEVNIEEVNLLLDY